LRKLVVLGVVLAAAATAGNASAYRHTALAQRLENALAQPGLARSSTGAIAIDLQSRRVIFEHNAAKPLAPASNEKLAVTYTALVKLGARYRFHTRVYLAGRNLYLRGGGDPTLHVAGLRKLALQLRAHGIRRVRGDVLADESAFDTHRTAPGWKPEFFLHESSALSALVVARGTFHRALTPDPAGAAAALFVNQLKRAGIRVDGESAWGTTPKRARLVAQVDSEPLSEILRFMDRWSDNFTAEMVMKTLGHGTTAGGAAVVVKTLQQAHVPLRGVRIADGSGLSTRDRFTARALASILVAAWRNPHVHPYVWRALPIAGLRGTLSSRMRGAKGLVHAKTGTTDIASALSGYAAHRYVFAVVNDGNPVALWSAHAAQDRFATTLAIAGRCRARCL
jgi:D-alanyl-D-alanine carboxypeptidase/D-alanyl-D-alanine-endopeptidase (penicillin-binding protein 4)